MAQRLKNVNFTFLFFVIISFFTGCRQELPVTATITVDTQSASLPVNPDLYGISLEEINHAIDGGLYAELIRNRSFEDGVTPVNCRIDFASRQFITPNGLAVSYCGEDSLVGWHKLSAGTQVALDEKDPVNDKNKRSLRVSVYDTRTHGRGGVVAEGYEGIALKKGEKYNLSFFVKSAYNKANMLRVALEKKETGVALSDVYAVSPLSDWQRLHYTFIATEDAIDAQLVFSTDSVTSFWLDVVSLFPEKTWQGRFNGARPDLMAKIAALHPAFVRFPGGNFVEGYSAGTYPEWKTTIGNIATRRHFLSFWGYGTTNGMGFHEYLQLCEDLQAEPVYVVNCGITNQERRPRYQDIMEMDALVQDVLDAIEYAVGPAHSTWGAVRKANGHPEPFHLKYIEIGNENYGYEYSRRYEYFDKAIREKYPDMTVIATDYLPHYQPGGRDMHFFADAGFFMSQSHYFNRENFSCRNTQVYIEAFSAVNSTRRATLQNAIAEACFMIGAEQHPDLVRQMAYAPLLANVNYADGLPAAIYFDNHRIAETPSYYLLQQFAENRGDEVLKSAVSCYAKPQVTTGGAGIYMFDDFYEIEQFALDGQTCVPARILGGEWQVRPAGKLIAAPNKWNYILCGDTSAYNYELTARIRRIKGSTPLQFRLRDNGRKGREQNYLSFILGPDESRLLQQSGQVTRLLSEPAPFSLQMNEWYAVKVTCRNDTLSCYVNDSLLHQAVLSPVPALVAVVTRDKKENTLILKVVNTTHHPEKTNIEIAGTGIKRQAEVITLSGEPDAYNTLDHPDQIYPRKKTVVLDGTTPVVYDFPPNSVTILKLKID